MITPILPNDPVPAILAQYLLSDRGLIAAIKSRKIKITPTPTTDQIQPASLDVRIGKVKVFDGEAMAKTHLSLGVREYLDQTTRQSMGDSWEDCKMLPLHIIDAEPTDEFAVILPNQKDIPITLPPGCYAELYFHESIDFDPREFSVQLDLRSSRGRLGLTLDSMMLQQSDEGPFVSLRNNNPNSIILYGQSKFGQLFFYPKTEELADGYVVTDPKEAEEIARTVCTTDFEMYGPYILLTVGDHILRFNENIGPIDTENKPASDVLYKKIATTPELINTTNLFSVCQIHPKFDLSGDVGIQILHQIPFVHRYDPKIGPQTRPDPSMIFVDHHTACAGWVDPGYQGFVTAHPVRRKFPLMVKKGTPIGLGLIHKYDQPVLRSYGSDELKSHYQGSTGVGSRS
ncbi:hypothetical protein HN587_06680 [Candidatus Woesearchaeota archaeon]|nr:hypothetical protein [Candidatus Woesearchaeota archaeon]